MSQRTLPLLFVNLGGEMLYVLQQRLHAQGVDSEKSGKVMNDIISTMFNNKFIEDIFTKHQPIYSRKVMKTMFSKLAHASIMKLNPASMDKLYDLMTMAVKHQVLMCRNPCHLISVSLNHLDSILNHVTLIQVKTSVQTAFRYIVQNYVGMSMFELQSIRYSLLSFFQDVHVRVSIYLAEGLQHKSGRFVIYPATTLSPGMEPPGDIRFMDGSGEIRDREQFYPGERYSMEEGVLGLNIGDIRTTPLGTNMYSGKNTPMDQLSDPESPKKPSNLVRKDEDSSLAKEELNLLARLIGTETSSSVKEFKLNLFEGERMDEDDSSSSPPILDESKHVSIDLKSGRTRGDLEKIIDEMTVDVKDEEDEDLLALMDKAI